MKFQTSQAILRRAQVEELTGLSRSTIYARISQKSFPAPIALGPRSVGWRLGDIEAFLVAPATYRAEDTTCS
ncbi:AlpA family phage regulatory protein [Caballeronia sp. ATUFL_F1_KS4A]|uniref:helix-turn-helix transcriptional regulator n=1 Tax=Caballeronia sp. ATUFL_F1_KS4A TaxID=2921768 RepID=UPI002027FE31|nr:AlpA family phage regulatory protein [Caballeronia sp. ATUFL_F1_KS4A]